MYDNIGEKIKGLAKGFFIAGAVLTFIAGVSVMAVDEDLIVIGLPVMLLGPIISWISSWMLYGFGELVDKVCDIELNTCGGEKRNAAPLNSYSERISKIDTLRSQGLITEEEYQAKRKEIISNL